MHIAVLKQNNAYKIRKPVLYFNFKYLTFV